MTWSKCLQSIHLININHLSSIITDLILVKFYQLSIHKEILRVLLLYYTLSEALPLSHALSYLFILFREGKPLSHIFMNELRVNFLLML